MPTRTRRCGCGAIEGTGGGAGLTRHLARAEEVVHELDRPERAKRRRGAKSDPLDAARAAREAISRPLLGTPRTGGDRQALSVLLAARRSAVEASTAAQRQLFSLVIAAPERLRIKLRGKRQRYHAPTKAYTSAEPPTARPPARSAAASSATSPETSSDSSNTAPPRLDGR